MIFCAYNSQGNSLRTFFEGMWLLFFPVFVLLVPLLNRKGVGGRRRWSFPPCSRSPRSGCALWLFPEAACQEPGQGVGGRNRFSLCREALETSLHTHCVLGQFSDLVLPVRSWCLLGQKWRNLLHCLQIELQIGSVPGVFLVTSVFWRRPDWRIWDADVLPSWCIARLTFQVASWGAKKDAHASPSLLAL